MRIVSMIKDKRLSGSYSPEPFGIIQTRLGNITMKAAT